MAAPPTGFVSGWQRLLQPCQYPSFSWICFPPLVLASSKKADSVFQFAILKYFYAFLTRLVICDRHFASFWLFQGSRYSNAECQTRSSILHLAAIVSTAHFAAG